MTSIFRLYGKLLQPWITVAAYFWMLEVTFCFASNDPEPFLDRAADCSAILWTLLFWVAAVVMVPWLSAAIFDRAILLAINEYVSTAALVVITALAFARWLFNWAAVVSAPSTITYILIGASLVLAIWVWLRWKRPPQRDGVAFSLNDAWYFCVLPVLVISATTIGFKVASHQRLLNASRASLGRNSRSLDLQKAAGRPNVVLIVADALRAQNMSLYGYARKTTPFLESFAQQSSVYTQMYSNSTSTRTSLTSILSGKHPFSHGRLTKFLPAYDSPENLLALLRDQGYTTAAITSNSDATLYLLGLVPYLVHGEYPNFRRLTLSWLRDLGVYPTSMGTRLYDELARFFPFLGFPHETMGYGSAEATLQRATQLIATLPQPYFLFIHIHEPHNPYETPVPFRNKYAKLSYRDVERKISSDYYGRYKTELQSFVDAHRDHYDEAIEYLDSELAKFLQSVNQSSKSDNTMLVLTGDHGESFERGFLNHGEDLYESSIHIPLIVKSPNQRDGEWSSTAVQSIDLAPTVVQALGLAAPPWMDCAPLFLRQSAEPREIVMVNYKDPSEKKIHDRPTKLAIRWRQYKLIVNCDVERAELYDLDQDIGEQVDLSARESGLTNELWKKLEQRLANQTHAVKMACALDTQ